MELDAAFCMMAMQKWEEVKQQNSANCSRKGFGLTPLPANNFCGVTPSFQEFWWYVTCPFQ